LTEKKRKRKATFVNLDDHDSNEMIENSYSQAQTIAIDSSQELFLVDVPNAKTKRRVYVNLI
jgi:hypothetical protein